MSNTTTKERPAQFSCEMNKSTAAISDRIKEKFGISKKFQLRQGLFLLEDFLSTPESTFPSSHKTKGTK